MDRESFRNPGVEYRAVPFWSWNDWLEDGELVRQIDEMEKAGWGRLLHALAVGSRDALHDAGNGWIGFAHASRRPGGAACTPGSTMKTSGRAALLAA